MKDAEVKILHQQLNDRGWRLRFHGEMEHEFQQHYLRRYYTHMQIAGILGLLAFMSCGLLDLIWMPEMAGRTWLIRLMAGIFMGIPLILSFWKPFKQRYGRYMQFATCIFAASAVVGLILISLNSLDPYNHYYFNAITVALVMVFVLSRIQFKWGVISAVIMWFALNIGLIWFDPTQNKSAIVTITNYMFLGSSISALIGTFLIERSLRRNYLQSRLLSLEKHDLEASNLKLQYLSAIDGLTRIANRRHLDRSLAIEWQRSRRNNTPIGFIMADIDHFKKFNDTYGHQAGDECLRVVASLIKDYARRPGDLAARYGGEEFALMLNNSTAEQAEMIAEHMRKTIMGTTIKYEKSVSTTITASFGVASMIPDHDQNNPTSLIQEADQAMYRAKKLGRNRVEVSGQSDDMQIK